MNPNDNIFSFENPYIFYINIKSFYTHLKFENDQYYTYDLREPRKKIYKPDKSLQPTNKVVSNADDWSNIPYYPTTKERRQLAAETYLKNGKQIPNELLKQIQKDKEDTIKNDVYNITNIPSPPAPPNKYSPQYANYVGARPIAVSSAKIKLGGVYK